MAEKCRRLGVAFGRFQPLHLGHVEYLESAMAHCDLLIVGITNVERDLARADPGSPHRADQDANPLSYFERARLISEALPSLGFDPACFMVVPFPIETPQRIRHFAPREATYLVRAFGAWGRTKISTLTELGLRVVDLHQHNPQRKLQSGTEVRRRIVAGDRGWRDMVPTVVALHLERLGLLDRIRHVGGRRSRGQEADRRGDAALSSNDRPDHPDRCEGGQPSAG